MRTRINILAAALAAGGIGFGAVNFAPAQVTSPRAVGEQRTEDHPDIEVSDREANNIRGTLEAAVQAALTQRQFHSMVQRFTEADQARLQEYAEQRHTDLDELVARFNNDWNARYGNAFAIDNRVRAFPPEQVAIRLGIEQDALPAGARQQPDGQQTHRDRQQYDGQNLQAEQQQRDQQQLGAQQQQPQYDAQRSRESDAQAAAGTERPADQTGAVTGTGATVGIEAGRTQDRAVDDRHIGATGDRIGVTDRDERRAAEAARHVRRNQVTVVFKESGELPKLKIPMVNEGTLIDAWRIDVPLAMNGEQLKQNLMRGIQQAHAQQAQWPADQNDAARLVAHYILASILGETEGQAQPAGARIEGDVNLNRDQSQVPQQQREELQTQPQ